MRKLFQLAIPLMLSAAVALTGSAQQAGPQPLRLADLADAAYVVSFDVPLSATAGARGPRVQWDGLPSVSKDYANGRDAIKLRVHALVDSLKRAEMPARRRAPSGRGQLTVAAFSMFVVQDAAWLR